ncbi:hypothetical protein SAMN04489866_103164 [Peptococcus niger]|uniref:Uncharacterized protein n=2 Tax=Peptococcus niger TaxID=2741 RepID=A0A1G6UYR0_PEPNI|nr:hypothetical protein SAMN04489866_103164 [Peptococcus niger]
MVANLQALSSNLAEARYARNAEVTITPEMLRAAGMEYSDTIWDSTGTVNACTFSMKDGALIAKEENGTQHTIDVKSLTSQKA